MKALMVQNLTSIFVAGISFLYLLMTFGCKPSNYNVQQVVHDTIYIEKEITSINESDHVLQGTTVLKASPKNMESMAIHGISLTEIKSSKCLESQSESPSPTKITSITQTNDTTLVITANVHSNCSYSFLGEIEVPSSNIINLVYHEYGGFASCSCSFDLTYIIKLVKDRDYSFKEFKYVTIDGIAKTPLPKIR